MQTYSIEEQLVLYAAWSVDKVFHLFSTVREAAVNTQICSIRTLSVLYRDILTLSAVIGKQNS